MFLNSPSLSPYIIHRLKRLFCYSAWSRNEQVILTSAELYLTDYQNIQHSVYDYYDNGMIVIHGILVMMVVVFAVMSLAEEKCYVFNEIFFKLFT
jgi:hypothetical protein